MLESKASQFTLSPEGKILWQEKLNNPLPGVEVASLVKGDHPLRPSVAISQTTVSAAQDQQKLQDTLNLWFNQHLSLTLDPLVLLGKAEDGDDVAIDDPVKQIAMKVYDNLGIVPREELESVIEKLDPEKRTVLRNKKIRLGPILVFIPALNKPAAVRLRGLLWCLYHDCPLPAKVPADGIVSQKVETEEVQEAFYRSVGYPIYGGRAVRIDMLDRVISSIYDNAKDGIFEARHEMAEWLGTPIDDLYKILESMGHKKIEEPPTIVVEGGVVTEPALEITSTAESVAEEKPSEEKKPDVQKPALARFRLKRGKAFQKQVPRPAYKPNNKAQNVSGEQKPKWEDRKKSEHKKSDHKDKSKFDKGAHKKNKNHKDQDRQEKRVVMLESKKREEDSPFAILQQLVVKKDG